MLPEVPQNMKLSDRQCMLWLNVIGKFRFEIIHKYQGQVRLKNTKYFVELSPYFKMNRYI